LAFLIGRWHGGAQNVFRDSSRLASPIRRGLNSGVKKNQLRERTQPLHKTNLGDSKKHLKIFVLGRKLIKDFFQQNVLFRRVAVDERNLRRILRVVQNSSDDLRKPERALNFAVATNPYLKHGSNSCASS
jgi:hypothetical protein